MRRQRNSLIEIKHSCQYGTGDIVELFVDLDQGKLSFSVNGENNGIASDIDSTQRYRAVVSLYDKNDEVQLL